MRNWFYPLIGALLLVRCTGAIKDTEANVAVEAGTQVVDSAPAPKVRQSAIKKQQTIPDSADSQPRLTGYWVGYFKEDREKHYSEKAVHADVYSWQRENKINISIDTIAGALVRGHSVVAGNNRPFEGSIESVIDSATQEVIYRFEVREPGDDQYDGTFTFEISNNQLVGTWQAYRPIEIPRRKYTLESKSFAYDPDIVLERTRRYIDWNNVEETAKTYDYGDGEVEEWISQEFASATDQIYHINASNTRLVPSDVENLKRGDLIIIRNTIYARHGYSFKHRPLRVFFDAQPWYVPVHADIRSDFTDIEKQNLQLLLRYEKNAAEYYDYFGRG